MEKDICEQLLEEYQVLRRRLEELEFAGEDITDDDSPEISEADLDRFEELQERLVTECDIELPEDPDTDLDLPEYAVGSPSEPRDISEE